MVREHSRGVTGATAYGPDRTAVWLYVAIHGALALVWTLAILRPGMAGRTLSCYHAYAAPVTYYAIDRLFGLWLCAGVFQGRRWAFVGTFIHGAIVANVNLFFAPHVNPYAVVGILAAVYALARLLFLGPRLPRPQVPPGFVPDRIVGAGYALLNSWSAIALVVNPPQAQTVRLASVAYLVGDIALCLWSNVGVYRSRGWSIGTGLTLCVMGLLALQAHPEQRAQAVGAVFGIFYFSLRLYGFGPKVEGVLGVRSA